MTTESLHIKLSELVKSERKITHEILLCIQQMDQTKAYAELGYPSLFEYLVKAQKYSEGAAQRRISAARLLRELPEIEKKVQEGNLNLTQLSKLASATNQDQKATGKKVSTEQKRDLLEQMENKTGFETEQLLNQNFECNLKPKKEITPRKQAYELHLKLTPEQYEKLKKAQSLLSHVVHDGGFAEIIEVLCEKFIQKKEGKALIKPSPRRENESENKPTAGVAVEPMDNDQEPIAEAKSTAAKAVKSGENTQETRKGDKPAARREIGSGNQPTAGAAVKSEENNQGALEEAKATAGVAVKLTENTQETRDELGATAAPAVPNPRRRTALPVSLQRLIYQRAQACCEYVSATGHRCRSRYQIQLDHIVPVAKGGGNEAANLRVLCRTHNLTEARRWGSRGGA